MESKAYCCCDDYPVQIEIIVNYITLASVRSGRLDLFIEQGGKIFVFCPYCGLKLKKDNES